MIKDNMGGHAKYRSTASECFWSPPLLQNHVLLQFLPFPQFLSMPTHMVSISSALYLHKAVLLESQATSDAYSLPC
jgi:hypothetical protein